MTQPDRVEIKGQEYRGWTHTLGIEVEPGRVVLDTFWRHSDPHGAAYVALDPAGALRAAAELVRAAGRAMVGPLTLEQAREVSELQQEAAQLWTRPGDEA